LRGWLSPPRAHEAGALVALCEAGFRLRAREFVAQLCEFDLELGLPGLCPLGEDFEDQPEPIDHTNAIGQLVPDVERLVRPQFVVDDHGRRAGPDDTLGDRLDFPLTEVVGRILRPRLRDDVGDLVARCPCEVDNLVGVGRSRVDALGDDSQFRGGVSFRHSSDATACSYLNSGLASAAAPQCLSRSAR